MSVVRTAKAAGRPNWLVFDKLGVLIGVIAAAGVMLPFALFRANRIVAGEGRGLAEALPSVVSAVLIGALVIGFMGALFRVAPSVKLVAGVLALIGLAISIGWSARYLTPPEDTLARVSPAGGFWLLVLAFALLVADALIRLRPGPWLRITALVTVGVAVALLLWSGTWDDLSILREYANRAPAFWQEARAHLVLAFGSVAMAAFVGVPIGVLCHKLQAFRTVVLNGLNIVQTIPSIALFGLLIAPLAWVAANVPGAAALGISGIGTAPAMVALFAYSLLPLVSNTVVGLQAVPASAVDAAKGMGMSGSQRFFGIELPLAFPVILTGIRIVLVQNIGLATIAALIGGGGFGVFVFQGIGQTAMDLVLLGTVPTVALSFAAAVVLDALVELSSVRRRR
ncbi:ABC transporter permease [Rubellimicrobium rubrum]|uniref:ABC transporter permease n=1 Tax=Rubellimicrobium rubrum TaxID=2585369 RepID=A0A5C4MUU9_9RHOB|nr:ABC transporter permease [Rubellimicrobium rubrum]TNC48435.1 ABC transporter permease [Rubellimicrobium rubrum]